MKKFKFNKISIIVLAAAFVFELMGPSVSFAATAPNLGTTSTYGIVSSTYTNSLNAGLETKIVGDVCYTTGPTTAPVSISGATVTPCTNGAAQAAALADLNSQACTSLGTDVILSGTYTPGCYSSSGSMDITLSTTVTLDGPGVYIFRSGGALTTGANSVVALTNGASASDVFWTPGSTATLGANSATSSTPTFVGTIIADELGSTGITLGHFANLLGRVLAFGHTVTTDSNTITVPTISTPPTLHLRKTVSGGTALDTAWTLTATGTGVTPTNLSGTTPVDSGVTFQADTYTLAETGPVGYTSSLYSCVKNGGLAVLGNSITLVDGDDAICTITNTYPAPTTSTLNVIKVIVNDDGRNTTDFPLFINGTPTISGTDVTLAAGTYTVTETSNANYTQTFSASCPGGIITLVAGVPQTCTITNDDIAVPRSSSGSYVSRIPPILSLIKVPTPLALPAGPGPVVYTYTLRNVGTVPVNTISVTDNFCSPVTYVSGDTNLDAKLDLSETWIYRCAATLSNTTTNTASATGWANGISTTDIASATVVVGGIGFPDTGVIPPLINVTKVPSPLSLLLGWGLVTYTKRVTNPGIVPLSNVTITDDKCSPVNYISGDVNNDSLLDHTETWTYTCQAMLSGTTTNTARVSGEANGITATDFAIATVVAYSPGFPKTGFPPQGENNLYNIIILVSIIILSSTLAVVLRKV